jgi:hypothetical protein
MQLHLPNTKNISFLFSGGVDSTLLLYMALCQKRDDVVFRAFGYNIEQDRISLVLEPIIDYMFNRFNYRIPLKVFNHKLYVRPTVEKVLGVYPGVVYTGCNKVMSFPGQLKTLKVPVRGPPLNEYHLRPFIDMTKVDIALLYKQYMIEDLWKITYSCMQNDMRQCGRCYFCLERSWASNIVGITDNHVFRHSHKENT